MTLPDVSECRGVGGVGVVSGRVEAVSERCRLTLVSEVSEVPGPCPIGV